MPGYGQTDGDQREIVPFFFGVPDSLELRVFRVVDLKGDVGGIKEDQVHLEVEKVGRGPEELFLDGFSVLQQKIHSPVEEVWTCRASSGPRKRDMLEMNRLMASSSSWSLRPKLWMTSALEYPLSKSPSQGQHQTNDHNCHREGKAGFNWAIAWR